MEIFKLAIGLVLFFSMLPIVQGDVTCEAEQIQIIDPSTRRVIGCKDCLYCQVGFGPTVTCGGSVIANTPVKCVPCIPGKTYSTGYSPNACQDCTNCGKHRTIDRECTAVSDTQCGNCKKGYYEDGFSSMCQPCSQCCGDGDDNVMKKCTSDRMPTNKQCSYGRSECPKLTTVKTKKPLENSAVDVNTTAANQFVMSPQNETAAGNNTKYNEKNDTNASVSEKSANSQLGLIVGVSLACVFVLLMISIAVFCWFKHRANKEPEHNDERTNVIGMPNIQMPVQEGAREQNTPV